MSNTSKGSDWVRKVRGALEDAGHQVRRRGIGLPGDDLQTGRLSIECKDVRRWTPGAWVDQAVRQAPAHLVPVVWAHRYGKSQPGDGFVILRGTDFLRLIAPGGR